MAKFDIKDAIYGIKPGKKYLISEAEAKLWIFCDRHEEYEIVGPVNERIIDGADFDRYRYCPSVYDWNEDLDPDYQGVDQSKLVDTFYEGLDLISWSEYKEG